MEKTTQETLEYECIQCYMKMTTVVGEVIPIKCKHCGYRILAKVKRPMTESHRHFIAR